jgi:ABC-type sugar transport system permease subunit
VEDSFVEGIKGTENAISPPTKIIVKKKAGRKWFKRINSYLLLLPAFIFTAGILIYPTIRMLQFSFLNWSFGKGFETAQWAGLENYGLFTGYG